MSMLLLTSLAVAEPPPMVPLDKVVADSELVVVATAKRVFFEALEPGESVRRSSHDDFWVEYRIDEILFGGAPAKVGEVLRIDFDPGACEMYDSTFRRKGDRYFEDDRELKADAWLPDGPQILLLDVNAKGQVRQSMDAFWESPKPATKDARANIEKLLAKTKKSKTP